MAGFLTNSLQMAALVTIVLIGAGSPALADAESDWHAGYQAAQRGEDALAVRFYTRALERGWLEKADRARVLFNRGAAYRRLGDYDWAIEDYGNSIKLQPNFAEAFHNRGIAYHLKGEQAKAALDFKAAHRLRPDDPDIRKVMRAYGLLEEAESLTADVPVSPIEVAETDEKFALHLASLRTKAAAKLDWSRLKAKFPDLLSGRQAEIVPVDLENKGVFNRVFASPFSTQAEAEAICGALRAQAQYCKVVKR